MSRVLARPLDTRTIALSVAGLLAVGTGVLTYNYLASVGHANAPATQRVILVAAKPIPAHAIVTADMLARTARPADSVDPDAVIVPANAIGSQAAIDIPAGGQLTASKLVRPSAMGLPGKVHLGMRAVSIALDRVKGVSNLIRAGDRVDVIAASVPRPDAVPKAVTIIRGALVLSIGSMIDPGATPAPDPNGGSQQAQFLTATLEVDPAQADLLTLADVNTTLRLALRSPHENPRSRPAEKLVFAPAQAPVRSAPAVTAPAPAAMPAVAPKVAPASPKAQPTPAVSIIDGDRVVTGNPGR